jgi:hypothetical protein
MSRFGWKRWRGAAWKLRNGSAEREEGREVLETGTENRLLNETDRDKNGLAICDLH